MVKVYTKSQCQACKLTKRLLTNLGVKYETVNIDEQADQAEMLISKGFTAMPVVDPGDDSGEWWSGFRPDRVKALAC